MPSSYPSRVLHPRPQGAWAFLPRLFRRPALYILTGLILTAGIFFTGLPQASAYDCPSDRECHFVRIDQDMKIKWKASMTLYNGNTGEEFYAWEEKYGVGGSKAKSGAYALWWWNLVQRDTTTRLKLAITQERDMNMKIRLPGVTIDDSLRKDKEIELDPHQNHCITLFHNQPEVHKSGADCTGG